MTTESKVAVQAVAITLATETAVATSDTVQYSAPQGEGLVIRGVMNVTAGTGTTAVTVRCRKGANTTSGALVGVANPDTLAAGNSESISFEFLDTAPVVTPSGTASGADVAGTNVYTITLQQTGGTGNGTVNYGSVGVVPASGGW